MMDCESQIETVVRVVLTQGVAKNGRPKFLYCFMGFPGTCSKREYLNNELTFVKYLVNDGNDPLEIDYFSVGYSNFTDAIKSYNKL